MAERGSVIVLLFAVKAPIFEANDQVALRTGSLTLGVGESDDIANELRLPARITEFDFQLEFETTALSYVLCDPE